MTPDEAEALRRQLGELAKVMKLFQSVLAQTIPLLERAAQEGSGS